MFLPIRRDFLLEKGWWSKLNTVDRASYEKDVEKLANFFLDEINRSFSENESGRWTLVEEPDEDTLIVEYALVEVVATKVHINAVGLAAGFAVAGGGLISSTAGGSIAFEAKIFDGQNGELLAAYADREVDKVSIVSLKDYQFYAHAKDAISEWAEQFAELANSEKTEKVDDSLPVNFSPW